MRNEKNNKSPHWTIPARGFMFSAFIRPFLHALPNHGGVQACKPGARQVGGDVSHVAIISIASGG